MTDEEFAEKIRKHIEQSCAALLSFEEQFINRDWLDGAYWMLHSFMNHNDVQAEP